MDLVDANDGSGESDPHNSGAAESSSLNGGRSSGGGNIGGSNPSHSQSSSAISIVHVSVPQAQVQSVIQPTSVIQSTPSLQATSLPKGNIILVSKPNSVIHTTGGGGGSIQTLQVIDNSGLHEDENTKKRREILARRPSYRKILNELGGCEISEDKGDSPGIDSDSSSSSPAPPSSHNQRTASSVAISGTHYQTTAGLIKVLPGGTIQLATPAGNTSQGLGDGGGQTLSTLTMTNTPGGGAIVQYAQGQDGQFFVPVCVTGDLQAYALRPVTTTAGLNSTGVVVGSGTGQSLQNSKLLAEEASRNHELRMKGNSGNHSDEWDPSEPSLQKRELRLLKNREAARECRRKKKEYIKCLENRVAVLENQNKALIEELKSLKELYCSQKTD
ncbi:cyclic AMP-dependent transcription factor ATF-1-like isoform X2 [Daphnia pulex]|uniref:cyclic AMP-dependent transcription factor ATF-1-like isoform X2 n=1 Tax=Daphnia pulex TaxID=6669 RepID=UPI001EE05E5E|nr:cyclic AMP-dependent transcription factor ATF-1-like isoform X2 [Daphnia pulex]XP_046446699.1 cyclic AMP-dependent transcription factor ATF-1-like isoform X2 [Daphnia pulex]XP_046446700.1 cyclic AMP-dependent transcription factor ATF-1-like isoform X2 [Daphnia pulex]XP_046446701.1 cyclic AMP-dependent transcription factor ATF-1-like isoform X2 [Daphnia pulex]XP_046446703.1 cyclic AMP-dependent transcription factor ATF-1-like isoform X2 [Daphnia pulex]XP_046446704.1 cyclic AMP-dependent tran